MEVFFLQEGKLGSVLFMDADTPVEVLMEADNRVRNLETEKDNLKHQIKVLTLSRELIQDLKFFMLLLTTL